MWPEFTATHYGGGVASNSDNKNFVYWKVSLPKMWWKMNNTLDKPDFNLFFIAEERNALYWSGEGDRGLDVKSETQLEP